MRASVVDLLQAAWSGCILTGYRWTATRQPPVVWAEMVDLLGAVQAKYWPRWRRRPCLNPRQPLFVVSWFNWKALVHRM